MLFSRTDLAEFIQSRFEPVWQEVRAVPLVHIDFGHGERLTRTLHGNIATWVCLADGSAVDVLPGLYEPATYRARLEEMVRLVRYIDQEGPNHRAQRLNDYHRQQAGALAGGSAPLILAEPLDVSKVRVERNLKLALRPGPELAPANTPEAPTGLPADDAGFWRTLAADTLCNEKLRRRAVHELLAHASPTQPAGLTRRLYKEILHADLDDPYLGLGSVLDRRP